MKTILLFWLFAGLFVLPLSAVEPCPVCGGELTTVGKVKDDPSKPNKNQWVWRRSKQCGLQIFTKDSPICKRCWFVSDSDTPAWWMRSSELPDAFLIPFSAAIRAFPAPPNSASYDQRFVDGSRTESINFRCKNSPELIAKFRKYCKEHKLSIDVCELSADEVFVDVEPEEAQQDGAGEPATRSESDLEGGDKPQQESEGRSQ